MAFPSCVVPHATCSACRSCRDRPAELRFDRRAEPVRPVGMLALRMPADGVQLVQVHRLHDQGTVGPPTFRRIAGQRPISGVRRDQGVVVTAGIASMARPRRGQVHFNRSEPDPFASPLRFRSRTTLLVATCVAPTERLRRSTDRSAPPRPRFRCPTRSCSSVGYRVRGPQPEVLGKNG